jgi:peptidoglycan/xylan/chitin deacetylase (PgdA/CDA1 family)
MPAKPGGSRNSTRDRGARRATIVVIPLRIRNALGVYASGYQTIPILCYHRFGPRATKLNVAPAAFEAQMEYLARNGYTVITLKRLARFLEGTEPLPAKTVAITIDDGYRSTYEIAYPILRKFGFPATVFLYTDFVGASDAMTWPQMKEMEASGLIDIQPHSKSHANLALRLPGETEAKYKERIKREVDMPVAVLRDRLGDGSFTYAYPYGDVNEWVVDLLTSQKVTLGVTVTPGGNGFFAYPFMLRRSMVFGDQDLEGSRPSHTFVRPRALTWMAALRSILPACSPCSPRAQCRRPASGNRAPVRPSAFDARDRRDRQSPQARGSAKGRRSGHGRDAMADCPLPRRTTMFTREWAALARSGQVGVVASRRRRWPPATSTERARRCCASSRSI